jgi:hypothetical protein
MVAAVGLLGCFGSADSGDTTPDDPASGVAADNDTDADGIADDEDLCPEQAGAASARGCPGLDDDGEVEPDSAAVASSDAELDLSSLCDEVNAVLAYVLSDDGHAAPSITGTTCTNKKLAMVSCARSFPDANALADAFQSLGITLNGCLGTDFREPMFDELTRSVTWLAKDHAPPAYIQVAAEQTDVLQRISIVVHSGWGAFELMK